MFPSKRFQIKLLWPTIDKYIANLEYLASERNLNRLFLWSQKIHKKCGISLHKKGHCLQLPICHGARLTPLNSPGFPSGNASSQSESIQNRQQIPAVWEGSEFSNPWRCGCWMAVASPRVKEWMAPQDENGSCLGEVHRSSLQSILGPELYIVPDSVMRATTNRISSSRFDGVSWILSNPYYIYIIYIYIIYILYYMLHKSPYGILYMNGWVEGVLVRLLPWNGIGGPHDLNSRSQQLCICNGNARTD